MGETHVSKNNESYVHHDERILEINAIAIVLLWDTKIINSSYLTNIRVPIISS